MYFSLLEFTSVSFGCIKYLQYSMSFDKAIIDLSDVNGFFGSVDNAIHLSINLFQVPEKVRILAIIFFVELEIRDLLLNFVSANLLNLA